MKRNKENQIRYANLEAYTKDDMLDIVGLIIDKIKEEVGQEIIYVVCSNYDREYKVEKQSINDIIFSFDDDVPFFKFKKSNILFERHIKKVFKDELKAKEYALSYNLKLFKERMESAKKSLDAYNPALVIEKIEKDKQNLINFYNLAKEQYEQAEKSLKGE